ncbi:MAG: DUF2189 domain-containing protein [Thioclava marina]|jgi:Predicted integral membrane protein|uniref:DUF2189 domain-containing protein n=1 Tax=Thioclava marina TaxID=1915077 RepID=A0ABX3MMJ9_9RHOB|nr:MULTISPECIES: DUF2189 domain-containing protein [Thioclava]TNE94555.1 MAG: DUF2189 domain-containing protein [Paracoccaceae bacterium]MBC7143902.1 DUF2189 domain-containing protein [Thioclava marina]MBD3802299.1 DUF2189 domain-containing protein [Thioclava sp.]OOY12465.1 hypothetical protein BMG00_00980 [Thioclava marina]OOY28414.1 hypothetical protein BMI90_06975 [Thioclava sp. L04-15]
MQQVMSEPSELPHFRDMPVSAIPEVLREGWRDFLRAPAFGLMFSGFYVLGGIVLWMVFSARGEEWWLIPFALGFPLLAPFAAIGLYEISRRIEGGEPLVWGEVMACCISQKDRQIPSMAMLILMMFMFWVFVAHTTFALFMGLSAFTNVSSSPEILFTGNGLAMLAIGSIIGAIFALTLFSFTVVGLPLLMEREIDIITAILTSMRAVIANPVSMGIWGLTIALSLFIGMIPMFLGLLVVLPVLGHASWHMYRRLTY